MYPSKGNADAGTSNNYSETSRLAAPSSASGEKNGSPPAGIHGDAGSPSAPLLPSSPYNPAAPEMDPPPYSSVVAQDSADWRNRASSFSGGNNSRPYPPSSGPGPTTQAPYPSGPGSGLGPTGQAPYPSAPGSEPGPITQAPYPTGPGLGAGPTAQAPYPEKGFPSSGPPMQPPYPSVPYPPGPVITSQPPYPTPNSAYNPGLGAHAPYPGAMPMPSAVDVPTREIGFTAPVTVADNRSGMVSPAEEYVQTQEDREVAKSFMAGIQGGSSYRTESGANDQYVQTQYVPNQYGPQQPNTVYVVQKTEQQSSSTDDDCCFLACCLASCYCFVECLKLCTSFDS